MAVVAVVSSIMLVVSWESQKFWMHHRFSYTETFTQKFKTICWEITLLKLPLSCRVPRPRWWGKGETIRVNRSLKVYCILSNAETTCSPDQKAVQEIVSVTDYWIKSARISRAKIMVSPHLVECSTSQERQIHAPGQCGKVWFYCFSW